MTGFGSPLRQRLGLRPSADASLLTVADASIMARALMYLLAAVGTAVIASVAVPDAPLNGHHAGPVFAGIAYVAAIGVFAGFERLPSWALHALLIGVTGLIVWAVYESGDAGSPYTIFLVWVAIYAAFFFGPLGTALQVAAMLAGYGGALLALGDQADAAALHFALTASALVLLAGAIQALTGRVARLVSRLQEISRTDSVTGLYDNSAFAQMLEIEIERARRSGNRLGLVLGDLGDVAGRAPEVGLIQSVGALFGATPRQIDMCARLDNGRFAMLLPYTDEHGSYLVAERMRERVAVLAGGGATMTFGVAGFPRAGATGQALLRAAEAVLDEAHAAGGDRVVVYQKHASNSIVEIDVDDARESELQLS